MKQIKNIYCTFFRNDLNQGENHLLFSFYPGSDMTTDVTTEPKLNLKHGRAMVTLGLFINDVTA